MTVAGGQRGMPYAERRARAKPKPFPLEPLAVRLGVVFGQIGSVEEATLTGMLARRLGVDARNAKRMRQDGLSAVMADKYSVAIGVHPAVLWPEVWDVGREPEPGPPARPSWLVQA